MKKTTFLLVCLFAFVFGSYGQIPSYSFSQSQGVYTPLVGGTTLASYTGSATGPERMDDVVYTLPAGTIPFPFVFNNITYDAVNVSSNGYLTFGTTLPANNNFAPLSTATAYEGAISAFGRDLEGGFLIRGDRTSGSTDILNVTTLGPIQVGDFIDGNGIPAGTTITAISGTTITLSAAATTTGVNTALRVGGASWSNIQYGVIGDSPNRVFVVQYTNFKRFGLVIADAHNMNLNFQIRLYETTNYVEVVYGDCTPGLTTLATTNQVGLRGATNNFAANINNRTNTKGTNDNWLDSAPGINANSGMVFNNNTPANVIENGLTYIWSPPLPCSGIPSAGTVTPSSLSLCSGTVPPNLVATGFTTNVTGLTFQWEESIDNFTSPGVNANGGSGATTTTYTPPAYSGTPIYYRLKVTCTNSSTEAYSNVVAITSATTPANQVTALTAIPYGVSAILNWTNGSGNRRVVVLSDSSTITDPTDGSGPALVANAAYAGSGQQIIYDGVAATVTVSSLTNEATYYVKVYELLRCGTDPYDYYYNVTTGTNETSFTTLVPPSNDNCANPIALTAGGNFAQHALATTNAAATLSPETPIPSCDAFNFTTVGKDLWYTVQVPASGSITIETDVNGGITDSGLQVYSGTCGSLVAVGCNTDSGNQNMSLLSLTGRTPGEILIVRVYGYNGSQGSFLISAYDASLSNNSFDNSKFTYYPNPVKDVLNLSYNQNISQVEVYSLLGQRMTSNSFNTSNVQMDMSNLTPGVYLVKVTSENNTTKTVRVIKE